MYINMRGKRGVPNCTIRELLDDAEEIKQLYEKTLINRKRNAYH